MRICRLLACGMQHVHLLSAGRTPSRAQPHMARAATPPSSQQFSLPILFNSLPFSPQSNSSLTVCCASLHPLMLQACS